MKTMTVRNIPQDLSNYIDTVAKNTRQSLNATVVSLLYQAMGGEPSIVQKRDLSEFCGTWTDRELEEFEKATECFSQIDDEMWQA